MGTWKRCARKMMAAPWKRALPGRYMEAPSGRMRVAAAGVTPSFPLRLLQHHRRAATVEVVEKAHGSLRRSSRGRTVGDPFPPTPRRRGEVENAPSAPPALPMTERGRMKTARLAKEGPPPSWPATGAASPKTPTGAVPEDPVDQLDETPLPGHPPAPMRRLPQAPPRWSQWRRPESAVKTMRGSRAPAGRRLQRGSPGSALLFPPATPPKPRQLRRRAPFGLVERPAGGGGGGGGGGRGRGSGAKKQPQPHGPHAR